MRIGTLDTAAAPAAPCPFLQSFTVQRLAAPQHPTARAWAHATAAGAQRSPAHGVPCATCTTALGRRKKEMSGIEQHAIVVFLLCIKVCFQVKLPFHGAYSTEMLGYLTAYLSRFTPAP